MLDIELQLLLLEVDTDSKASGGGLKLPKWKAVNGVADFVPLLLAAVGKRLRGNHTSQPGGSAPLCQRCVAHTPHCQRCVVHLHGIGTHTPPLVALTTSRRSHHLSSLSPPLVALTTSRGAVLLRANPGTGKSWSMEQLLVLLAKAVRRPPPRL
eukprot:6856312-Prymnesium_polylepis.1